MTAIEDRITAVLRAHPDADGWFNAWRLRGEVVAAVAAAVVAELQLTQENTTRPVLVYDDPPAPKDNPMVVGPDQFWATHFEFVPSTRFVSEWEPRMEHAESQRAWEKAE